MHSYHFSVEEGLPKTQVLLWRSGEQLRAVFENVLLAEYHCRYDWAEALRRTPALCSALLPFARRVGPRACLQARG